MPAIRRPMFRFLQKFLKYPASEFAPASELAVYPGDDYDSPAAAIAAGIVRYRREGKGRRAVISWQGQGGRLDSYEIFDVHLDGDELDFNELPVDLPQLCSEFALDSAALRAPNAPNRLRIAGLAPEQVVNLLEHVFVRQLGSQAFSESGEYAVGVEYDDEPS